ncbi:hypothetical protein JYU34_015125 [Plutella xylostella]|uniref:Secreted protein n=1 Tax=Plutella xylostella TaxID=51655 RepID=A0ABQ7Q6D8_PLUXY|nr:hypothetical protein JYU34_015125 [Plutella xylostella]
MRLLLSLALLTSRSHRRVPRTSIAPTVEPTPPALQRPIRQARLKVKESSSAKCGIKSTPTPAQSAVATRSAPSPTITDVRRRRVTSGGGGSARESSESSYASKVVASKSTVQNPNPIATIPKSESEDVEGDSWNIVQRKSSTNHS